MFHRLLILSAMPFIPITGSRTQLKILFVIDLINFEARCPYNYDVRNLDSYPVPKHLLAVGLVATIGGSVLAGCGSAGPEECLTAPVLSQVFAGSLVHKAVIVTVPRLGDQDAELDVGFRTISRAVTGQWDDSNPIPESFLAQAGQRVIVGIKNGRVQFRFAEVISPSDSNRQALGHVGLSAQTTEQAQLWSVVSDKGVLPAWPIEPVTIPTC